YDNEDCAEQLEILCWMHSKDVLKIVQLECEKKKVEEVKRLRVTKKRALFY
ncbi:hypothetical protein WUBG_17254, partial [Wuchereria bancrofti]